MQTMGDSDRAVAAAGERESIGRGERVRVVAKKVPNVQKKRGIFIN